MNRKKRLQIKLAIVEADKKICDVERLAGLPHTKLSRIINGTVTPSWWEKEGIARVLGRPVEELFE